MSTCRVAIIQLTSTSDKSRNREKCFELLSKAKNYGAQVAFLPEVFDFIGESANQTAEMAETIDAADGIISHCKRWASQLGLALSLGGNWPFKRPPSWHIHIFGTI